MAPVPICFSGREGNRLNGCLRHGDGAPVLLLHGAGQTRHAWEDTASRLAEAGLGIVTVDLRGHGDSDWVHSAAYTIVDFAGDVAEVARAVEARFGTPPAVVGASLGGLAALGAELFDGPLFSAMVLVDVTPRLDPEGVARIQGFMMERMNEGFSSLEEASEVISRYLPHRKPPRSLEGLRKNLRLRPDGRYRWHWDPAFFDQERGVTQGAAEFSARLLTMLPRLSCDLLLVRAGNSEVVDDRLAAELLTRAPKARAVSIEGASHMIAGDGNNSFTTQVLAFLRSLDAVPAG